MDDIRLFLICSRMNGLRALSNIPDVELANKILRSLPEKWEQNVADILR